MTQAPGASSALRELATESAPAPVEQPAAAVAQPLRSAPPRGLPAMDILPAKSGGGRSWLRRSPKKAPALSVQVPVPHQEPVAARPAPSHFEPAPSASHEPIFVGQPEGRHATDSPASTFASPSAPTSTSSANASHAGADGTPDGPIAAPSSLFSTGAPTPAGAGLPARSAPAPAQPAEPQQAVPALAAAQSLRERSAMASEALSELSALSTYRPEKVQAAPANLAKRTPQATPAGQLPPPPEPPVGSRRPTRNAADVRSMLSGFQAGVERGRTSPAVAGSGKDDGA